MKNKSVNSEGLTWEEWSNAANASSEAAHKAWFVGEDPTEWKADHNPKVIEFYNDLKNLLDCLSELETSTDYDPDTDSEYKSLYEEFVDKYCPKD
ncbi:MAG: hypothetical protein RL621_324 [Bacteroidota bacterium]